MSEPQRARRYRLAAITRLILEQQEFELHGSLMGGFFSINAENEFSL